jgi:hypothetical protein
MSELLGGVPANQATLEGPACAPKKPSGRLALELLAMRGKDVVGARHLHDGGTAWIGNTADTLARVSMREHGGQPLIVGDVRAGTYAVHVPPRARARVHRADGVPRLLMGPARVELREGERAVLVLGAFQIRAQVVPFEVPAPRFSVTTGAVVWMAVLGALYAAAIAFSAVVAHPTVTLAQPGGMQRVHERFLPRGR